MDAIKEGMLASAKAAEAAARIGERLFCQNTPNVMNFNSQICTSREQSERLLALGLKKETADMTYQYLNQWDGWYVRPIEEDEKITHTEIPAWSLNRLLKIIQPMMENQNEITIPFDNIFDQIIDCTEWLINEGYFNKEYLEDKK